MLILVAGVIAVKPDETEMARLSIFDPPPPGELDGLANRLRYSDCLTRYQQFCVRVAEKALDLPLGAWQRRERKAGGLQRHQDRMNAWSVQRWLLEAARIDGLSAMVILDATSFFDGCLQLLTGCHDCDLFGSRFKRGLTQRIQGTPFVFRIPAGWELSLFNEKYDEGNYGVARLLRCHLSESSTHQNWGLGELLGRATADSADIGYFDVPCEIAPKFKRMPIDVDDELWMIPSVAARIPYQWIIQAWSLNEGDRRPYLRPALAEHEILEVAVKAVQAVKERVAEIESQMRPGEHAPDAPDTGGGA